MRSKEAYLVIKVTVPLNSLKAFNDYWVQESLPFWLKHGAKHIGSFVNYVGGPANVIYRFFMFRDIAHWEQFEQDLVGSEEGAKLRKELQKYDITIERKLLRELS